MVGTMQEQFWDTRRCKRRKSTTTMMSTRQKRWSTPEILTTKRQKQRNPPGFSAFTGRLDMDKNRELCYNRGIGSHPMSDGYIIRRSSSAYGLLIRRSKVRVLSGAMRGVEFRGSPRIADTFTVQWDVRGFLTFSLGGKDVINPYAFMPGGACSRRPGCSFLGKGGEV